MSGEVAAVRELDAFAKIEVVLRHVGRYLPAGCQLRHNLLHTISRVAPDQIVIELAKDVAVAALMHVKV